AGASTGPDLHRTSLRRKRLMRCNWLRAVHLMAITAALGCASLGRPAAAAQSEFVYTHDLGGNVFITQLDPRNGKLLPLGSIRAAKTSPASKHDSQTLDYSPSLRLLVVSNGNGGAGAGTLSVLRVGKNGALAPVGTPVTVPGSGDLTNVLVV